MEHFGCSQVKCYIVMAAMYMSGWVLIHLEDKHQIMPNNGDSIQAHIFVIFIISFKYNIDYIAKSPLCNAVSRLIFVNIWMQWSVVLGSAFHKEGNKRIHEECTALSREDILD